MNRRNPVAIRLAAILTVASCLLAGCAAGEPQTVWLTRRLADQPGPARLRWAVRRAVYAEDARGCCQLLAESPPDSSDKPIGQWLYVRLLWPVRPTRTGSDATALNAQVGYLVLADPGKPSQRALYYEGTGNVYVDRPGWPGGGRRFQLRHAMVSLSRSGQEQPADPFGPVRLEATLTAGADPEAGGLISRFVELVDGLRPVAERAGPSPGQAAPRSSGGD